MEVGLIHQREERCGFILVQLLLWSSSISLGTYLLTQGAEVPEVSP